MPLIIAGVTLYKALALVVFNKWRQPDQISARSSLQFA
tara:strand:- start:414 stop:527 length:114 start_codon:yes stop_codon:yes gene_type:complete